MDQLLDQILCDRYCIQSLLGRKTGRRAFLATDLQTKSPVVIKLLLFNPDFTWDDLKLFEREAKTLKALSHPEIPKYLDYFEVNEVDTPGFALVQSYIEAPSLATLILRGRKFSEAEIIELADRLLNLLTYLHQQHPPVIHRDIKPSNILLGNRSGNSIGDVYLVDFGSVQTVAKKEEGTITIVGSYGYIPLEQFGGQATTASDLYSLGMTLIYLLTGTHPAELPQVDGRVKFDAEISKRFERWLDKMIHPHLDKRFDSAKAAQLALKSEDGSYGNFDRLKPAHTQIRLYRDQNRLKITWQQVNTGYSLLLVCLGVLCFLSMMIIPFIGAVGCFLLLTFISPQITKYWPKTKCQLFMNDRHIYSLKGYKKSPVRLRHLRSQIEILAYNPGYTFNRCLDTNGNLVQGSTIAIPPKLYLYCENLEYSIPTDSSSTEFSQAELWWLGQELSDFLNLELQVIYPTPEVPPASFCGGGC